MEEKNKIRPSVLYLVSTPIGNLADLSERAVKTLSEVDFISAEDTRNSGKLLSCIGISKPMISYHEHNKAEAGNKIVERLLNGESCALITDAGTPAISDPGEDLVKLCIKNGITVTAVPGCVASIDALVLSGLPTGRFTFEGFLPVQGKERKERLISLQNETRTMLFHEAPHKLKKTLSDFQDTFGRERKIALCRELTKLNEEIFRASIEEAVSFYEENEPRGEYVLVVDGCKNISAIEQPVGCSIEEQVKKYLEKGYTEKDAIKQVAKDNRLPKNEVYIQVKSKK